MDEPRLGPDAWVSGSRAVVELCDRASDVLADPHHGDSDTLATLASELAAALQRLQELPRAGQPIDNAVHVLSTVDEHTIEQVIAAIGHLRELSSRTTATSPGQEPVTEPLAPLRRNAASNTAASHPGAATLPGLEP